MTKQYLYLLTLGLMANVTHQSLNAMNPNDAVDKLTDAMVTVTINAEFDAFKKVILDGGIDKVRSFCKENLAKIVNDCDVDRNTLLHSAVYGGQIEIVTVLLEAYKRLGILQSIINVQNNKGQSALMWAVIPGYA